MGNIYRATSTVPLRSTRPERYSPGAISPMTERFFTGHRKLVLMILMEWHTVPTEPCPVPRTRRYRENRRDVHSEVGRQYVMHNLHFRALLELQFLA